MQEKCIELTAYQWLKSTKPSEQIMYVLILIYDKCDKQHSLLLPK